MQLSALFALWIASAINAGIPGPCMILTVARTARAGPAAGIRVSTGILAGDTILAVTAIAALAGLLTLPYSVFVALKWVGAVVLLILAIKLLSVKHSPSVCTTNTPSSSDLLAGLFLGLSSPFNLIFYFALLPQFIPTGGATTGTSALLIATLLTGGAAAQIGAVLIGLCALKLPGGGILQRLAAFLMAGFAASGILAPIG